VIDWWRERVDVLRVRSTAGPTPSRASNASSSCSTRPSSLFSSKGYANTRIADICAEAGVAKGLIYWYFPTKEELFA
jgi:hypothetical protein